MEDNCFTVLCWFLPLLLFSCSAAASDSLLTPWAVVCEISLSFTVSQSLLKFKPIGSMMPSNHLIFCHLLLLLHLIVPSIRVFSNDWTLHIKWPKYWNFSISLSTEYSGLISFRINWFALLAVPGTLKLSPKLQFESINSLALSLLCLFDVNILIFSHAWRPSYKVNIQRIN